VKGRPGPVRVPFSAWIAGQGNLEMSVFTHSAPSSLRRQAGPLKSRLMTTAVGASFMAALMTSAAAAQLGPLPPAPEPTVEGVVVVDDGPVEIATQDPVITFGFNQPGVLGRSFSGDVSIFTSDITTEGGLSDGIFAEAFANDARISITSGFSRDVRR
jgi:hypothetical protein